PGQALTAAPPCGGVIVARLTTRARTRAPSATPHPAYTRAERRRASSAANAGSTSPAVTQTGGRPGPPGLSRSSGSGPRRAGAGPGGARAAGRGERGAQEPGGPPGGGQPGAPGVEGEQRAGPQMSGGEPGADQ